MLVSKTVAMTDRLKLKALLVALTEELHMQVKVPKDSGGNGESPFFSQPS